MANVFEPEFDESDPTLGRRARLARQAGAERLGASLYEVPAGAASWPFHYHHGNEEMLIVISGHPSLRTMDGWRELEPGEVVAFPRGQSGAHQMANHTEEAVRFLVVGEMNAPEVVVYPDSDKVMAMSRAPGSRGDEDELAVWFRLADQVDYWEGEDQAGQPGG
jgi:uncharacterized cupin superfamily protein